MINDLPDRPFVSLAEASTWLATGKARDKDRLRWLLRTIRRPVGTTEELRDKWLANECIPPAQPTCATAKAKAWRAEIEDAAQRILHAAGRGDPTLYGSIDSDSHQPVSIAYLASPIFADPFTDSIQADPLKTFDEYEIYRNVVVDRAALQRVFGGASESHASTPETVTPTAEPTKQATPAFPDRRGAQPAKYYDPMKRFLSGLGPHVWHEATIKELEQRVRRHWNDKGWDGTRPLPKENPKTKKSSSLREQIAKARHELLSGD